MMRVLTVIVVFLLVPLGLSFGAQPEDQRVIWNWAWRDGELFAYSSDGDMTLLSTEVTEWQNQFWRISDSRAVGLLMDDDDQLGFYDFTPQSVQAFVTNFDVQTLTIPLDVRIGYRLEAYHPPYMLFTPESPYSSPPSAPALLLNLDSHQIDLLTEDLGWMPSLVCCRFTEDGQRLRYPVVIESNESQTFVLRERVLATGEERELRTFGGEYSLFFADGYGERWLVLTDDEVGADGTLPYEMFNINGVSEQLPQTDSDGYTSYEFFGNDLISYQPLCSLNCPLRLLTSDGDLLTFELPAELGGQSIDMLLRYDEQLVVGNINEYWVLSSHDEPTFIGYNYHGSSPMLPEISPDGRWVLTTDAVRDVDKIKIWDLIEQKVVLEVSGLLENPVFMVYDADGFIVHRWDNPREAVLYRYSDRAIVQLPDHGGIYFDVLPDGNVLYIFYNQQQQRDIYRYNTSDSSTTLLIENAVPLWVVDANDSAYPLSQT